MLNFAHTTEVVIRTTETMMQDYDPEEPPVPTGDNGERKRDFLDSVCDPLGLIPSDLEKAFAHAKRMKLLKEAEQAAANAESAVEAPAENSDEVTDETVEGVLSTLNCCGKSSTPAVEDEKEKESPDPEEQPEQEIEKNDESASVFTTETRSLAEIAAKMDDIDLETITDEDQADTNTITKISKDQAWYKQPLYATLIVLSAGFSIAIVVMAILLIVSN